MIEFPPAPALSPNQQAWRRFLRHKPAMISGAVLLFVLLCSLVWPLFQSEWAGHFLPAGLSYPPNALSEEQFKPPSLQHWFGTDVHGRDVLSRVTYGLRVSFLVGFVGALVSLFIGVTWGAVAGYAGGKTDGILMRLVDVLYALPSIVFVIVMITALEGIFRAWIEERFSGWISTEAGAVARLLFLFVGLGAVSWLTMARIVRGQVLTLRQRSFVEASRVLGAGHVRILARHILPNLFGIVIVYLTLTIPSIVLYESFLSYLGLGIQPPQASLGTLIAEGASQINPIRIYWWMLLFPAGVLAVILLALNLFGDGLRDAFDPRRR